LILKNGIAAADAERRAGVARTRNATAVIIAIAVFQLAAYRSIAQQLCNPLTVADAFMAKNYPLFDSAGLRPVMSDLGNIWTLTYRLPPGYYGAISTVIIEKRTCSVISMQYRQ
jgi:hypothetical protein